MLGWITHFNFRRLRECSTLLRWLQSSAGERILDVGCGDGYYSERIARTGAAVVGIDINRKALARAQKRRRPGLEFVEMNAEELDFPEACFDKIVSFCVIEHFANDEQVLALLARALRPGGLLVFSADSLSLPGISELERGRHRSRYAVNSFYTADSVRRKLQAAGLRCEQSRYILSGAASLALARFTWKMDLWPPLFAPLRLTGYLLAGLAGIPLQRLEELACPEPPQGLTLLVAASRPG